MDGQQRMLLEISWEVLSEAEATPDAAASTAVAVGIGTVEYNSIAAHLGVGIYVATGKTIFAYLDFSNPGCPLSRGIRVQKRTSRRYIRPASPHWVYSSFSGSVNGQRVAFMSALKDIKGG